MDGPPLVYVLNLVNTKQDNTVKRGAVVKAMAICTRHSFLHIYKPLLLLALEQYFAHPQVETLESLYNAVNNMDLSLMPRLNTLEKFILERLGSDLFGRFGTPKLPAVVSCTVSRPSQWTHMSIDGRKDGACRRARRSHSPAARERSDVADVHPRERHQHSGRGRWRAAAVLNGANRRRLRRLRRLALVGAPHAFQRGGASAIRERN